jgi:hypothetical protein
MKARNLGLIVGVTFLAACASNDVAQKDTLNEPSDRMAATEDRLPPNPNRPRDNRELKSVPPIVQHDPALNKPEPDQREDKGLAVNPGQDQLIRPQHPAQTDEAPAVGGPATTDETAIVSKSDNELATRVKDAITKLQNQDANVDPVAKSQSTSGEAKAIQNLEVTAKNGVVTLSGSVGTENERTSMEQAASRVTGVTSVNNNLTVSKATQQ